MVNKKAKNYQVFLAILKIGTIGFGGGAATIPLFHKEFVDRYQFLDDDEFSDMLAVANALPGPTQTKLAGYIGYRLTGIFGLILGLIGIIFPSLLIMLLTLTWMFNHKDENWVKGLAVAVLPVVTVLMANLTWKFFTKSNKALGIPVNFILLGLGIIVLVIFQIHPAFLILLLLLTAFLPKLNEVKRLILIGGLSALIILFFQLNINDSIMNLLHFNMNFSGNTYVKIFFAFLIPGLIGFGGGPASVGLVKYEAIEHFHLINLHDFEQAFAVQAMLPGVTATKLAGAIGYQAGGIWGLLIGVFAYALPSLLIMIALLRLINKYKESPVVKRLTNYVVPVIIILLGELTYKVFHDSITKAHTLLIGWVQTLIIIFISFILINKYKLHPFWVILGAMIYGGLFAYLFF